MTTAETEKAQQRKGVLFFRDRDGRSEKENQPSGGANGNHAFSFFLRKQDHYKRRYPAVIISFLCALRVLSFAIGYFYSSNTFSITA
jgi:hypothetical protein